MQFEFEKKVRFGEIDEAGIVYYPRFFNYYHLAMEEFFEGAVKVPYPEVIKRWQVGFPTVHVEADFLSPLHYGDTMTIAMSIAKIGRSSLHARYRVTRKPDGVLAAEARLTTVCVDMKSFRARSIPDELRRVFERYLDGASDGGSGEELGVR
jgi:4-hydroxybenzoyl-CoA thioesterase